IPSLTEMPAYRSRTRPTRPASVRSEVVREAEVRHRNDLVFVEVLGRTSDAHDREVRCQTIAEEAEPHAVDHAVPAVQDEDVVLRPELATGRGLGLVAAEQGDAVGGIQVADGAAAVEAYSPDREAVRGGAEGTDS